MQHDVDPTPAERSVYYRPQWSAIDDDGTIRVTTSTWEADEHSIGILPVSPGDDDFMFWAWLVSDPVHGKKTKSETDIAALKQSFAEAPLEPPLSST